MIRHTHTIQQSHKIHQTHTDRQPPTPTASVRSIDRLAKAHDASHYYLVPASVVTPNTATDVQALFRDAHAGAGSLTFRSGGTSLSGQGVTDGILADTRSSFRRIEVLENGSLVRAQPGATVRQVNVALARYGRKLGPDPASEIACTIGGVIANNSSGMACGIDQNSYRTLGSLIVVLPSGTTINTVAPDADRSLRELEPELYAGLLRLRDRVRGNSASVATIRRLFAMKNTMGYGVNSFLDFDSPIDILTHLLVGSEGTLGFIAEATFRTVPTLPQASTALAIFPTLAAATAALPDLVASAPATIELMDSVSLRVAKTLTERTAELDALTVDGHAALLIEHQADSADVLAERVANSAAILGRRGVSTSAEFSTDVGIRQRLWSIRKGLYTSVAGARPSGTTALLEDIAVPVDALLDTCTELTGLFDRYRYEESVIFGHAKDGNVHFMLNERFDDPASLDRYRAFTEDMVELVLGRGGSLKAEHGTGRIMAAFVERQYGTELYQVMREVKRLFDPAGILNPGSVLSDEADAYLRDLKITPTVEEEVDRCVECGYCEPACPSKDLTLTPRGRIAIRREMANAEAVGDTDLLNELRRDYDYEGLATCAVDGMCQTACPVTINTGDLVRRLRAENSSALEGRGWKTAAGHWRTVTRVGAVALNVADAVPTALVRGATQLGRALLGEDTVPLYSDDLPAGGRPRKPLAAADPVAVYLPSCIGTMFAPEQAGNDDAGREGLGAMDALLALCERAGVQVRIPEGVGSMCCGTPWKSKGHLAGYDRMREIVLPALLAASDGGRLPVICDATSCTEGLETLRASAMSEGGKFAELRFIDSIDFARDTLLGHLDVSVSLGSLTLHPTCSSTQLGVNDALGEIAGRIAGTVHTPENWGCCGFAGDRGMLHPELTASATAAEAAEVRAGDFDAHASTNRTCEIGMSRATGANYRHVLELLEEATRPTP
ncbi:FAD-binding and (Fe-S)-binding domain-containing protein [Glaciibacter superstes]|uniref:FAD-binding and (Fe-S)-binding domain-containing protein n=1 Tax=Glaciibacter superstes TaxID=501023 RepID=UPI0003B48233|nr:FAD-binding and (Fe-S)-binding domain-containing protein [Glaciibacter superstes]